jgi:hypothetical protein
MSLAGSAFSSVFLPLYSFCNCLDGVEPGSLRWHILLCSILKVYLYNLVRCPCSVMQFSIVICMLFAGTVFSATTSTRTTVKPPAATASGKVAIPRVLKPATPPTATDVKNSIVNWETSVNTVNDYLVRCDPINLMVTAIDKNE